MALNVWRAGARSRRRERRVRPSGCRHRVGHLLSCPHHNSHLLPWYCDDYDDVFGIPSLIYIYVPPLPLGCGETTMIALKVFSSVTFFTDFRIKPGGKHVQEIPDGWTAFVYTLEVPLREAELQKHANHANLLVLYFHSMYPRSPGWVSVWRH